MLATFAGIIYLSVASQLLQKYLYQLQTWLKLWHIKINTSKSVQITFTLRRETWPPAQLNGEQIPQANTAKYHGFNLDRKWTWKSHIKKENLIANLQHVLAARKAFTAVNRKQDPSCTLLSECGLNGFNCGLQAETQASIS